MHNVFAFLLLQLTVCYFLAQLVTGTPGIEGPLGKNSKKSPLDFITSLVEEANEDSPNCACKEFTESNFDN